MDLYQSAKHRHWGGQPPVIVLQNNRPAGHIRVIRAVERSYLIREGDILGRSRKRPQAHARQAAAYILRRPAKFSYPQVGKLLGGMNYTTIIHSCQRVSERLLSGEPNTMQAVYQGLLVAR